MKVQKTRFVWFAVLFLITGLVGLANQDKMNQEKSVLQESTEKDQVNQEKKNKEEANREERHLEKDDFEKNVERPHVENSIYIDRFGYDTQDQKIAYFFGNDLEPEFEIYEKETEKIIFEGKMVPLQNSQDSKTQIYKGDFTALSTPGEYYIQTAIIGQSYSFTIQRNHWKMMSEDLRTRLFQESPQQFWTENVSVSENNAEAAEMIDQISVILPVCLAYRLNPNAYNKEMTGRLKEYMEWLTNNQSLLDSQKMTQDDGYLTATTLVLAGTVFSEEDNKLTQKCNSLAVTLYQQIESLVKASKNATNKDKANTLHIGRMMAAAALYEATGNAEYHKVCKEEWALYRVEVDTRKLSLTDSYYKFLASYLYMACVRSVDVKICEEMMSDFMKECTQYLDNSVNQALGETASYEEKEREKAILLDAEKLAVADYILVSREYRNVCKQQLHSVLQNNSLDELGKEKQAICWMILSVINR